MVRNRALLTASLLGLLLGGSACVSETTSSQDFGDLNARQAAPTACWVAESAGRQVGYLVRFEEGGGAGSVLLSVRNAQNQDLGWIDATGRAWRYRPHEDPEWISTGSTVHGIQGILGLATLPTLQSCELSDLPGAK
ncbi:MAG: hypothetical protein KDB61_01545 [Planctomycetes bacterium]|nr:hypothetical protein [Planctomycetota bacterium]